MGAPGRARRFSGPIALALLLMLAGSTSASQRSDAADDAGGTPSAAPAQAPASLTRVGGPAPSDPSRPAAGAPPPALHIAAAGALGRTVAADRVAGVLLNAYRLAAGSVPESCHLPVSLLAAIGEVESGSLVGSEIDAQHRTSVLGPVLDGKGFAAVPDTDNGAWDKDTVWDRAVGPMQFLPSTWRTFGVDGDGDGVADPQDVEDATASAAAYLCYGGRDLARPAMLRSAILSYNHSTAYERLVMTYQLRYAALGLDRGVGLASMPAAPALGATPVGGPDAGTRSGAATARAAATPAAERPGAGGPASSSAPATHGSSPAGSPSGRPTSSGGPSGTPTGTPVPAGTPTGVLSSCAPVDTATTTAGQAAAGQVAAAADPTCPPCSPAGQPITTPTGSPTAPVSCTPAPPAAGRAGATAASPSSAQ